MKLGHRISSWVNDARSSWLDTFPDEEPLPVRFVKHDRRLATYRLLSIALAITVCFLLMTRH